MGSGALTVFIFGEAMLEYHSQGGSGLRYGGDTLNTAIHLARDGHDVAYVTALGTDPISDALIAAWAAEGIDTRHVLRHPRRHPGIYAIHLDNHGERSFLYWRDRSAAREMFDLPGIEAALAEAETSELLYFSLISLAILSDEGRGRLMGLARSRRSAGRPVAFDSNYRSGLWPDLRTARAASRDAMETALIGLPTNDDEIALWGGGEAEPLIAARWTQAGCSMVAVKAGERGCLLATSPDEPGRMVAAPRTEVVDTSGAGDAFNGGFLSTWLKGEPAEKAAENGNRMAGRALNHRGAIAFSR